MLQKSIISVLWRLMIFYGMCCSGWATEQIVFVKPVHSHLPNEISFEKVTAPYLRVTVHSWEDSNAPCFDELEVRLGGSTENIALLPNMEVSASSCIKGYPEHKIAHLNDGKFGNAASWISSPEDKTPWVQYRWKNPVTFDRIIYSRDRNRQYRDRLPVKLEVAVSDDGQTWRTLWKRSDNAIIAEDPGLTDVFSHWFSQGIPKGPGIDLCLTSDATTTNLSPYENQLRDAFLFEEIASLKMAGFGAVQRHLRQRHYPEYVEPQMMHEDVLPLPRLSVGIDEKTIWEKASCGTVHTVSDLDRWSSGPLLSQSVSAVIVGDQLWLQIRGNRFISRNLAMVLLENAGCRGLIYLRDNNVPVWKWIDKTPYGKVGEEVDIHGSFDPATLITTVRIPLIWFPDYEKRGLAVSLGIGGRFSEPGGHPVHFIPAQYAVRNSITADGTFQVDFTVTGTENVTVELRSDLAPAGTLEDLNAKWHETITVAPGKTKSVLLPKQYGLVGPEFHLGLQDKSGIKFKSSLFQYDPCYRPLVLMREMIERRIALDPNATEFYHFRKQIAIPGSVNPIYTDIPKELAKLVPLARNLKFQSSNDFDSYTKELTAHLAEFKKKHNAIANGSLKDQRALYWQIKLTKRDFFLTNEELSPLTKILFNKRHPFHPSHNYSDLFDSKWQPGGAVCLLNIPQSKSGRLEPEKASVKELVQAGEGIIRNPSPSFDAKKIFYAHRANQQEYFRIFEYDLTTGTSRRISADGPFHDFWPTELPDGAMAFISTRCKKKFICWRPQAFVLHRMEKDGSKIRELSYANLSEFAPSVKDDGRLLWTRSEYVDKGSDYGHTLWTIRIDGSMPELVFGNTINLPQGYANGRDVPDTREVCTIGISHFGDLNGPVMLLDTMKGPHDPAANQTITPEVPWPGYWATSETFREPFPITKDVIMVAWANRDRFGLWLLDRYGNREMIYTDPAIDSICPQPFQKREVPPVLLGSINQKLAKEKMGQFSVANVYRGLEGQVKPGSAKYLRICQELPAMLHQNQDGTYQADHEPFEQWYAAPTDILQGAFGWTSYVAKGVIGTVEIQADGSVDFLAPADKVLFFELLDENYNEIQRMRSVIQLQAGEQRSCIGCHENRLMTPEGKLTLASKNPANKLIPPPWGAGPFHFEKFVQPVLDKNCVSCHTTETMAKTPKQLDLTGTRDANNIPNSYRSLIKSGTVHYFDYVWWGGTTTKAAPYSFGVSKSRLFEILRDKNHQTCRVTSEEEQAIKCWIDLNVPLWGDYTKRSERNK